CWIHQPLVPPNSLVGYGWDGARRAADACQARGGTSRPWREARRTPRATKVRASAASRNEREGRRPTGAVAHPLVLRVSSPERTGDVACTPGPTSGDAASTTRSSESHPPSQGAGTHT